MSPSKENTYTIAVDVGFSTATVAYMNQTHEPRILDRTGGYGQVSVPTALIEVDGDYLIGEDAYAQWMFGDVLHDGLLMELIKCDKDDLQCQQAQEHMIVYIYELVNYIHQVNPNATIDLLKITFTQDLNPIHKKALADQLSKSLNCQVTLMSQDLSMIGYIKNVLPKAKSVLWVDYGYDQVRIKEFDLSQLYEVKSLLNSEAISGKAIESSIMRLLTQLYMNELRVNSLDEGVLFKLGEMERLYLPNICKKYEQKADIRLTFNFAFPPFQCLLEADQISEVFNQYEEDFTNILGQCQLESRSNHMIITGNGLKMLWPVKTCEKRKRFELHQAVHGVVKGSLCLSKEDHSIEIHDPNKASHPIGLLYKQEGQEIFHELIHTGDVITGISHEVTFICRSDQLEAVELVQKDQNGHRVLETIPIAYQTDQPLFVAKIKVELDLSMTVLKHISYYEI